MKYNLSNEAGRPSHSVHFSDSLGPATTTKQPSTIEEALLSASHTHYSGHGYTHGIDSHPTTNMDDKSSLMSAFETTKPSARRRKSSFLSQPNATVFSSIMNLCNTVIGAGILALPETMVHLGLLMGIALLLMFAVLSQVTLHLMFDAAHSLKLQHSNLRLSYLTMCERTVPRLKFLVDFCVGITCFGVCCAYLVVIGDLMPLVAKQIMSRSEEHESTTVHNILEARVTWIAIYLLVFIIPCTLLRKMDALRFTSTAAILCFAYVTVVVILYAFVESLEPCAEDQSNTQRYRDYCEDTELHTFPVTSGKDLFKIFKSAPTIIFAYTCHQNVFSVMNELEPPASMPKLNTINFGAGCLVTVLYCVVAFCGYVTFGNSTPSNLLVAYPESLAILILRICLSFAIAFSYPVLAYPARNSFASLIFRVQDASELHWAKHSLLTWFIIVASFGISMTTDDLGLVLGLVGSIGTTSLAFILPGLFYYFLPSHLHKGKACKKKLALCMIVFGCVCVPFSITMQFVHT